MRRAGKIFAVKIIKHVTCTQKKAQRRKSIDKITTANIKQK
jgi:hypothetical protein